MKLAKTATRLHAVVLRLLCRVCGHRWNTLWVDVETGRTEGIGACQRCGITENWITRNAKPLAELSRRTERERRKVSEVYDCGCEGTPGNRCPFHDGP